MPLDVHVVTPENGTHSKVNSSGVLAVGNLDFSSPVFKLIGTNDQVVNFAEPEPSKYIIITDISIYANKNVGANDSTVIIYEADDSIEAYSSQKVIFQTEMLKQTRADLTGLNWRVNEGKFLNATADDDDIFMTIAFYYAGV